MTPALIWFLIGFAVVLVEFALPGVIIVFLGLGAWVTALFVWLGWAESVGAQTAVFMISSVMLLFGLRHIFRGWFMGHSSLGDSESEMDEFLGKSARAVAAITAGGEGKVEFKGAHWNAIAEDDINPGQVVTISARDGLQLTVKKK